MHFLMNRLEIIVISYVTADCKEGEMRLQDGTHPSNGRVEVCRNGFRGSVCIDQWDISDAHALCRNLSFDSEGTL